MTWNYRMVRYPNGQGFGLHEVYYEDDGSPLGMTSDPCGFTADSPGEMLTSLNQARDDAYMLEVFDPPEEWGGGSGQPRLPEHIHREGDVVEWAEQRHIFDRATALTQMSKAIEEMCELFVDVATGNRDGIRDSIGDADVCLDIQAAFAGLSRAECKEHAWQEIKDRGGEMRNGVFVKEADLATAPPHTEMPSDEKLNAAQAIGRLNAVLRTAVGRVATATLDSLPAEGGD